MTSEEMSVSSQIAERIENSNTMNTERKSANKNNKKKEKRTERHSQQHESQILRKCRRGFARSPA